MVKITVLYGAPVDPEAFEHHYTNIHAALVAKMPHLQRFEASRVAAAPDGSPAPYYRIAELWFDSQDDLQAATSSPEGRETVDDIGNFATGGATVLVSEID
jgi:uncharacterized protein (TIGR02118 family)